MLACIAIPLVVGGISGLAQSGSDNEWFRTLDKPAFNPPGWVFGPVWTTLYLLMGISLYLIWTSPPSTVRTKALVVFTIQLILNFAWSFIFFEFQQILLALIEIVILWGFIIAMIVLFYRIHKTAAYLQVPYLLWTTFATVLNASIWILNN
jgi:translocator protein